MILCGTVVPEYQSPSSHGRDWKFLGLRGGGRGGGERISRRHEVSEGWGKGVLEGRGRKFCGITQ